MPKDVTPVYPFEGKSYGTTGTCEAQSFLYLTGAAFVLYSNIGLNFYYILTIRYGVSEETIKKWFEPVMLAFATVATLYNPILLLRLGLLNPTPFDSYCSVGPYPWWCNMSDDYQCIRGNISTQFFNQIVAANLIGISTAMVIVLVSMVIIVISVFKAELALKRNTISEDSAQTMQLKNTAVVLRQSVMYILAFWATWIWTVIYLLGAASSTGSTAPLNLIFKPLQGFFNALIFIYHKVHNLRRSDPNLGFCHALRITFQSPSDVPEIFLSDIEKVERLEEKVERLEEKEEHSSAPPGDDDGNDISYPSVSTPSFALSHAGLSSTGSPFSIPAECLRGVKPNQHGTTRFERTTRRGTMGFGSPGQQNKDETTTATNVQEHEPRSLTHAPSIAEKSFADNDLSYRDDDDQSWISRGASKFSELSSSLRGHRQ